MESTPISWKENIYAYPLLLPVFSPKGTTMSSGLIFEPFFPNSLLIFARSFSSFELSMTGMPSTTRMLSNPSSNSTLYLDKTSSRKQGWVTESHKLCFNVGVVNVLIIEVRQSICCGHFDDLTVCSGAVRCEAEFGRWESRACHCAVGDVEGLLKTKFSLTLV